jgi:two-component sensor histidine kinase
MLYQKLTARNTYLTEMLKQAGLDAQAREVADRIQTVLTDEIHHRMKNMLTIVTALVRQSMRASTSLAEAEAAIGLRLLAMSRAHDLLLKADWQAGDLAEIVHGAVEQHETAAGRFTFAGDPVMINSAAILPLTLALNELCTNAVKYGALSNQAGHVHVSWAASATDLTLRWTESGGPPVTPPAHKSFGTRLIEEALPRQLGGTGHIFFAPSGLEFDLIVPLDRLRPIPAPLPQKETVHA